MGRLSIFASSGVHDGMRARSTISSHPAAASRLCSDARPAASSHGNRPSARSWDTGRKSVAAPAPAAAMGVADPGIGEAEDAIAPEEVSVQQRRNASKNRQGQRQQPNEPLGNKTPTKRRLEQGPMATPINKHSRLPAA
eukprot:m.223734 g.223734  ORF g.223734 m.223734 type:complete len:139 (-) comp18758_c1_seq1:122-538(-)